MWNVLFLVLSNSKCLLHKITTLDITVFGQRPCAEGLNLTSAVNGKSLVVMAQHLLKIPHNLHDYVLLAWNILILDLFTRCSLIQILNVGTKNNSLHQFLKPHSRLKRVWEWHFHLKCPRRPLSELSGTQQLLCALWGCRLPQRCLSIALF